MRRYRRSNKHSNVFKIISLLIAILALGSLLLYAHIEEKNREDELQKVADLERQKLEDAEENCMITLFQDGSVDLLEDISAQEVLDYDSIRQNAKFISGYLNDASVQFQLSSIAHSVDSDKLYMIVCEIFTEKSAAKIEFQIDGIKSYYYITSEPSAFYLPINNLEDFRITLKTDFQNTYIGNLSIIETEGLSSKIKYGQYGVNETDIYSANILSTQVGREVLVDGEYIYYLSKNALITGKVQDGVFMEYGSISGLGSTVHAAFVNKEIIVVTSRENDVYFINVSDPKSLHIVSTYDSLDLATGVEVYGNYVFICSRYFGVELVDISNIKNPQIVSIIETGGECIDCAYNNGYLYISNWNLKQVWVYDVSNPNQPAKSAIIDTDGNPYGISVSENSLFVATGHNSTNESNNILDGGYGAGHGMEIYDVSNSEKITWKSTVKIDGRLLYRAIDSWGVYVDGKYAFLSSTYGGVYIYDVSNPSNPVRIGKISTKIEVGSEKYSYTESTLSIFPYDVNLYIEDPISSIAFNNGEIYLAGQNTGLYNLAWEGASFIQAQDENLLIPFDGSYFEKISDVPSKNFILYENGYCVNACDTNGEYVFLACGDGGIEILDQSGNFVDAIDTPGSAQDIIVDDNYAYVAEGNYGIEVYKITAHEFELISVYNCQLVSETVTQIRISDDFLIAQNGWTRIKIFDVSDPYNIIAVEDLITGTMYLKNLIDTSLFDGILGFGSSREIKIYSTSKGLQEIGTVPNSIYSERDGMCEYEGNFIAIKGNGYIVFSDKDIKEGIDFSLLGVYSCGDDYKLKGKVACYGGVMVVTDTTGKQVAIVNINDVSKPQIIFYFNVQGNPMVAKITDKFIYIPLAYQGLLIVSR